MLRATTACTFSASQLPKMSEHGVFCTFSTSQLPKVLRAWCALYILTWTRASRHNSVQLFISHLATWLCTRRFSEPTFRPSGATNHWKTQCFATLLPFRAPASSFFSLFLFSDLLSSALLFSDSSHCFSICPYCRKFDFKTSFDDNRKSMFHFLFLHKNEIIACCVLAKRTHTTILKHLDSFHFLMYVYVKKGHAQKTF